LVKAHASLVTENQEAFNHFSREFQKQLASTEIGVTLAIGIAIINITAMLGYIPVATEKARRLNNSTLEILFGRPTKSAHSLIYINLVFMTDGGRIADRCVEEFPWESFWHWFNALPAEDVSSKGVEEDTAMRGLRWTTYYFETYDSLGKSIKERIVSLIQEHSGDGSLHAGEELAILTP
jgi:hypothetical protein